MQWSGRSLGERESRRGGARTEEPLFAPQSLGGTYPSLSHAVWVMFSTVTHMNPAASQPVRAHALPRGARVAVGAGARARAEPHTNTRVRALRAPGPAGAD